MARFAELSESELYTILEEKDAENTKKAAKVTLNIFRVPIIVSSNNCIIFAADRYLYAVITPPARRARRSIKFAPFLFYFFPCRSWATANG